VKGKRVRAFLILMLLLASTLTITLHVQPVKAEPGIIVVPDDYAKIQWAVGNATAGDTIYVTAGTYYEHVVVDKSVALIGEDRSNTIIDGSGTGNVINIMANNVNITGFTIQKSGSAWPNAGIYISGSSGNSISGNNITNNFCGIYLLLSSNNNISGNNIANNYYGIYLSSSSSNIISGNTITANNYAGIEFYSSCSNNSISGNNIANNNVGIGLSSSSSNSISVNNIANNSYGIDLYFSSSNIISGNMFTDDGLIVVNSYNNSVEYNIVNGKPLVYLEGVANYRVGDAGQVILVRCDSIRVENLNLSRTVIGVELWETNNSIISRNNIANNLRGIDVEYSSNNTLSGNNITNNVHGIAFGYSSNNSITGNNITANNGYSIALSLSSYNTLSENTIANNRDGIYLVESSNNAISGNNITNNELGIYLLESSYNNVSGNNIAGNHGYGILIGYSSNNKFYHNGFINNTQQAYIYLSGSNFWDDGYPSGGNYWSNYTGVDLYSGPYQDEIGSDGVGDTPHVIDANNRDNYPLIHPYGSIRNLNTNLTYLTIQSAINAPETLNGHTIFVEEGTYYEHVVVNKSVALIGEDRSNTIIDGSGTGNVITITANNVNLTGFTIRNGGSAGIELYSSSNNNSISGNNIANNQYAGIYLYSSSNNRFFHNNFKDNARQVLSDTSTNVWDDGYLSGGNYWSNYTGVDLYSGPGQNLTGSDGIGDTPYIIDATNQDRYPLMSPWDPIKVFNVTLNGENYYVTTFSNITITHFSYNESLGQISFNVTGPLGITGFCNLTIPKELVNDALIILVDNVPTNYIQTHNATHYFLYFTHTLSTHKIQIIGGVLTHPSSLTIYETKLSLKATLNVGTNLALKFYSYSGIYEGMVTVWNGTTPAYVDLTLNVSHPLNLPIENIILVLTDSDGSVISTVTNFVVQRSHLFSRIAQIVGEWPFAVSAKRIQLFKELVAISKQWPYAPSVI